MEHRHIPRHHTVEVGVFRGDEGCVAHKGTADMPVVRVSVHRVFAYPQLQPPRTPAPAWCVCVIGTGVGHRVHFCCEYTGIPQEVRHLCVHLTDAFPQRVHIRQCVVCRHGYECSRVLLQPLQRFRGKVEQAASVHHCVVCLPELDRELDRRYSSHHASPIMRCRFSVRRSHRERGHPLGRDASSSFARALSCAAITRAGRNTQAS